MRVDWTTATSLTSSPGPRSGNVRPVFRETAWIPERLSTAVIGLKMERQLWNEGLLSTHLPAGETNANHLPSCRLAIQQLEEKELVSIAGVCYSRQLGWQPDTFLPLCSLQWPILSLTDDTRFVSNPAIDVWPFFYRTFSKSFHSCHSWRVF